MSSYTLYFINLRRNHRRLTQLPPKMIEALSVFKWSMYLCLIVQNKAKSIPRQKWFLKTFHSASNKGIYPPHPFLWKKLLKKTFLVCKNGVKSIQTAGSNGARTVIVVFFLHIIPISKVKSGIYVHICIVLPYLYSYIFDKCDCAIALTIRLFFQVKKRNIIIDLNKL